MWVGGLLAGVVAAGVAIVGLLIARGFFDIRVFVLDANMACSPQLDVARERRVRGGRSR